jgi:hypothetical protein
LYGGVGGNLVLRIARREREMQHAAWLTKGYTIVEEIYALRGQRVDLRLLAQDYVKGGRGWSDLIEQFGCNSGGCLWVAKVDCYEDEVASVDKAMLL